MRKGKVKFSERKISETAFGDAAPPKLKNLRKTEEKMEKNRSKSV